MAIRLWRAVEDALIGVPDNTNYFVYDGTGSTPQQRTVIHRWMRTNFVSSCESGGYTRAEDKIHEDVDGTFDVDDTVMFCIDRVISSANGNQYTVFTLQPHADTKPARTIPSAN